MADVDPDTSDVELKTIDDVVFNFDSDEFTRDVKRANVIRAVDSKARVNEGFSEWLFNIIKALSDLELGKFTTVLWAIWKQRNSMLWDNRMDSPSKVVTTSKSFLYEWIASSRKNETPQTSASWNPLCIWTPPTTGAVKCNIDATHFEDIKAAGIGTMVHDEEGKFIYGQNSFE
ncbi:uncharacterized protein LOC142529405 [Primulina tabacum]|uniref:uncharacterized protein LOC142529405 n=1 Tax=Primulina tabacum TaxID=48773 RepID=UPI003F594F1E